MLGKLRRAAARCCRRVCARSSASCAAASVREQNPHRSAGMLLAAHVLLPAPGRLSTEVHCGGSSGSIAGSTWSPWLGHMGHAPPLSGVLGGQRSGHRDFPDPAVLTLVTNEFVHKVMLKIVQIHEHFHYLKGWFLAFPFPCTF